MVTAARAVAVLGALGSLSIMAATKVALGDSVGELFEPSELTSFLILCGPITGPFLLTAFGQAVRRRPLLWTVWAVLSLGLVSIVALYMVHVWKTRGTSTVGLNVIYIWLGVGGTWILVRALSGESQDRGSEATR